MPCLIALISASSSASRMANVLCSSYCWRLDAVQDLLLDVAAGGEVGGDGEDERLAHPLRRRRGGDR